MAQLAERLSKRGGMAAGCLWSGPDPLPVFWISIGMLWRPPTGRLLTCCRFSDTLNITGGTGSYKNARGHVHTVYNTAGSRATETLTFGG
jgi:hypothetical protein